MHVCINFLFLHLFTYTYILLHLYIYIYDIFISYILSCIYIYTYYINMSYIYILYNKCKKILNYIKFVSFVFILMYLYIYHHTYEYIYIYKHHNFCTSRYLCSQTFNYKVILVLMFSYVFCSIPHTLKRFVASFHRRCNVHYQAVFKRA